MKQMLVIIGIAKHDLLENLIQGVIYNLGKASIA